ncbi:ABC transporter substrate-binding protein [Thiofaba sp. EF100]|jgi:phospholipid transport system substrate-binding protein|uniref:MlaC/ttg2D family ABC transporter substrate-binding protein n=1 Tax=Thiofaba sp. EF100 TaxID=3121274 RepID=UPI003221DDE6
MKFLSAVFAAILVLIAPLSHADMGPDELVRVTSDKVLEAIKQNREQLKSDPKLVYKIVDELVLPHFDFEAMSKLVLGANWRRATPAQQAEFTREFRTLLVRTYAKSLAEYDEQGIRYLPMRPEADPNEATVRTEIQPKAGPSIPVDYRLRKSGTSWKVFDVSIDAVSLVTNYRTTFAQDVQRIGMDGLIKQLQRRNAGDAA